jgi:hypothetical protein
MYKRIMSLLVGQAFALSAAPEGGGKPEAAKLPDGWKGLAVEVSKKVSVGPDKNEYQKVGDIVIPIPTLEAFGITAEHRARTEDDGADDGLPLYKDENLDWLFGAVVAQCKAQARNKLVSGTVTLKDGLKIAENFAELTAEGERRGNAEALKLAKEVQVAFASFVQGLGKSAQAQAVLVGLFRNKQALALQSDDNKTKFKKYLGDFAESLEEKDLERYQKVLTSVEEAAAPGAPSDW